ncbi:MAG: MBL fold metallo-hydrolase [Rhodospirillaceae bacterium]
MTFARALMLMLLFMGHAFAQSNLIQTGDLATRGLKESDFPRVKQLAPNVYAYEAAGPADPPGLMTTNSLIVVGPDGVIVADGQGSVPAVEKMITEIKKLTRAPIKYVVICSDHGDHTAGNPAFKAAFPDVVFISSPVSQKALAASANPPTETVADKRVLKVGNTEVEILNLGRAHTGGDLSVYVPSAKVLFMSEAYFHRLFPAMRAGYPSEWLAVIGKAQAMNATWYIPGHGFVDDAPTLKVELEEARKAIAYVIKEATRLHALNLPCPPRARGAPPPACVANAQANWGPYADWTLHGTEPPIAISRVYQEIEGKLP